MSKFWRSGMIDKKVVKEREQEEYINKLERVILELTREDEEPEYATFYDDKGQPYIKMKIDRKKPLTPTQSAKKCGEDISKMFINDYDEVRVGDNVILDFNKHFITKTPKTPVKDAIMDAYSYWLKNRPQYEADIAFGERIKEIEDESNTRTLRQEE